MMKWYDMIGIKFYIIIAYIKHFRIASEFASNYMLSYVQKSRSNLH